MQGEHHIEIRLVENVPQVDLIGNTAAITYTSAI
jgi:hypothetical protein